MNAAAAVGDWEEVKTISFLWDGNVPVWEKEQTSSGTRWVEWHFEPDTFVPIARLEGNQLCYVVTDHLGTPRELLSEDGQAVWAADYSTWGLIRRIWQADNQNEFGPQGPFQGYDGDGNPVYTTRVMGTGLPPVSGNLALKAAENPDPEFCPIRFQGQWADAETGLYYNRFRYYDPEAAQYLSPDPIGLLGGERLRGFVLNPNFWTDPLGLYGVYVFKVGSMAPKIANRNKCYVGKGDLGRSLDSRKARSGAKTREQGQKCTKGKHYDTDTAARAANVNEKDFGAMVENRLIARPRDGGFGAKWSRDWINRKFDGQTLYNNATPSVQAAVKAEAARIKAQALVDSGCS